jgi:hypothetical protein
MMRMRWGCEITSTAMMPAVKMPRAIETYDTATSHDGIPWSSETATNLHITRGRPPRSGAAKRITPRLARPRR